MSNASLTGSPIHFARDENPLSVDHNGHIEHLAKLLPVYDLSENSLQDWEETENDNREFELTCEMARILFRSKRRHVLLTGARGIGKSTLFRRFARRIRHGAYPFLNDVRIVQLDVENVGSEDSRSCLETIFVAVSEMENVIVCLDGVASLLRRHNGGTNGPLVKTLLSRSGIKCVGTMTLRDYHELVGSDAQLLEFFTRLDVREHTDEELQKVVGEAADNLGDEFELEISQVVQDRAIRLTSTYLLSESQPAKSIDVLRQVCEEIHYDNTQFGGSTSCVTTEDLVRVISERTQVPEETVSGHGSQCDFQAALSDVVVGQDEAVQSVATELQLISAGLCDSGRPASVMMFAGMTGVGKTELAKRVAAIYSKSGRLRSYTMGNFTEPHSVSGIIGVPPGYVGHDQGGRLINELNADPYSVFILDEAEKAHPNVWKAFLNLFDEGWIIDQRGVKAYADRAIFILTTNAGDRNIAQLFRAGKSTDEISQNVAQALSRIRLERSRQLVFPPQFLSRIGRIVAFRPLEEAAMIGIAQCAAKSLSRRWKEMRDKSVVMSAELIEHVGRRAHELNEKSGGREGGRIVQKLFSDRIEHPIFCRSLGDRDRYERCPTIRVNMAPPGETDGIDVEIAFE